MSSRVENHEADLLVVGTGIQSAGQTTPVARKAIEQADKVFFAVGDPWTVRWLRELNPSAEALPYPLDDSPRAATYARMVATILGALREGRRVCAVFYGHPSVLTTAGHEAVRQAQREGFPARVLPGVSALDCLFSDLCFDPVANGCLLAEADDFLERKRAFEARTPLILLQLAAIANRGFHDPAQQARIGAGLERLRERLLTAFPAHHGVILYEAPVLPTERPRRDEIPLASLPDADVSELTTLFVPAIGELRDPAKRGTRWHQTGGEAAGHREEDRP